MNDLLTLGYKILGTYVQRSISDDVALSSGEYPRLFTYIESNLPNTHRQSSAFLLLRSIMRHSVSIISGDKNLRTQLDNLHRSIALRSHPFVLPRFIPDLPVLLRTHQGEVEVVFRLLPPPTRLRRAPGSPVRVDLPQQPHSRSVQTTSDRLCHVFLRSSGLSFLQRNQCGLQEVVPRESSPLVGEDRQDLLKNIVLSSINI